MLALTYIIPAVLIGAGVALWLWRRYKTWRAERLIKGAVAEAWARTPKVTLDPDNPGTLSDLGEVSPHAKTIDGPVQVFGANDLDGTTQIRFS